MLTPSLIMMIAENEPNINDYLASNWKFPRKTVFLIYYHPFSLITNMALKLIDYIVDLLLLLSIPAVVKFLHK